MFLQFLQYFNWSLQKKLLKNNWQCNFHNVIRSLADRSWNLDSGWCNPACHMYQIFNPWTIYSKFHYPTFTGSIFFNFIPISAKASKYISRNHFQHWLFWAHHVGQILASFHLLQPFWENNCHEKGVFCGILWIFRDFLVLQVIFKFGQKKPENIILIENKTDWSSKANFPSLLAPFQMAVLPKDIAIVQDPKRKVILWCSDQITYLRVFSRK